jgi:hypothetical protein
VQRPTGSSTGNKACFKRRKRRAYTGQLNLSFASGVDSLPRFLAAAFLRFQCVEFEEEGRKAPLHAHESAEEKTGRTSQGLALEQLFILLEFQTRVDPRRPRPLNRKQNQEKSNPPSLRKSAKERPPQNSKAAPPAEWNSATQRRLAVTPTRPV